MAKVIFKKGSASSLLKTYSEGTIYITTGDNDRGIYLDISNHARIRIGMSDADIEAKISALAEKKIDDAITDLDLDNAFDPKGAADSKDAAINAAKQTAEQAQADVDTLADIVGDVENGKTVVELIADAQEAATYDDTVLSERVSANENALAVLNGDKMQQGSIAKQVADAVAAIVNDAPEAYDTLKEISGWISSHTGDAATMNSQIAANTNAVAALTAMIGLLPEGTSAETIIDYINEVVKGIKDYADTLAPEWGTF